MGKVICHQTISLDGYSAGPNQSLENPLGIGALRLHQWMFETNEWRLMQGKEAPSSQTADDQAVRAIASNPNVGAYIMGRNMFGPIRGKWDMGWRGWWGDDPPYHHPVFVLTHYARDPIPMEGGTIFHFVTDGIQSAHDQALEAADGRDVQVAGGASTVQQFLRAGYIDELNLHIASVVLGQGERFLDNVGDLQLSIAEVVAGTKVVHITYDVRRHT